MPPLIRLCIPYSGALVLRYDIDLYMHGSLDGNSRIGAFQSETQYLDKILREKLKRK
jgi:hypothetical protein